MDTELTYEQASANLKSGGLTGDALSSAQKTLDAHYGVGGQATPITSTPPVISSKDMASGFAQNSATLTQKTTPTTPAPGGIDTSTVGGGNGTALGNGTGTDTSETAVERGAKAGAGSGATAKISSGDPIFDSLQEWEQGQQTKNEQQAADQKKQVNDMLRTNLANTNASYSAQIQGINATYASLIDTQKQINNLNLGRVKAYGLASGNAMSTPIEFTFAVTNQEQAGIGEIQKLDNQRTALISQAQAAQADADAKLMQASMDSINAIEKAMQDATANLQSQVDARYNTLQKIKSDQQAELQKTQTSLLAAAVTQFGQSFIDEKDPAKRDALIKQIVNGSGGMLDYGTVYGSLNSNAASTTKAAQDAAAADADLKLKGAQTANAWASANKTTADAKQSQVFGAIDNALGVAADGTPMKVGYDASGKPIEGAQGKPGFGTPYTDASGYLTKAGFDMLVQGAGENGVDRQGFLKQYAGYLDPGGLANYGLTKAEQDTINNVNKTTTFTVPSQTGQ